MKFVPCWLLIVQVFVFSQEAYGKVEIQPAVLNAVPGQVSLDGHIEYLEDKDGVLTIDQVAASNDFAYAGKGSPSFGFSKSVYWFRFSLKNATDQAHLLLEQRYTFVDHMSVFTKQPDQGFKEQKGGDLLPFSERYREYRTITYQLDLQPGSSQTVYARTHTTSSTQIPLRVYTEGSFFKSCEREATLLGIYYGILAVMILFNGLLWTSLRDKTYLSYVGYLVAYLILQLTMNGNGLRYLFPESPALNSVAFIVSGFFAFAFAYRFTREFMNLDELLPKMNSSFILAERILVVIALLCVVAPYTLAVKLLALCAVVVPVTLMALGFACLKKGYMPAQNYLVAWSFFLFGVLIYGLKTLGFIPTNTFTEFAIQVGSAMEVTFLSLALADRFKAIQNNSLKAQSELVVQTTARNEAEKRLNQSLSSRLFLFSDLAHRINNPLNVALGGAQIGRDTGGELVAKVMSFFPEPPLRSSEEAKVVALIEGMGAKIESGFEDANAELCKAVRYVKDLRIIGGVDGADPKTTSLNAVMKECLLRVREDVGERSEKIEIDKCLDDIEVVGHPALLAVGLASWIKHGLLRTEVDESVLVTVNRDVEEGYTELVIWPESSRLFKMDFDEGIPAKDIVLGLLESQGSQWREDVNGDGVTIRLGLRLAATEDAWLKAQGAEGRK